MNESLDLKVINPSEHKDDCIELLQQLNPNREKNYLENTLNKMVKLSDYKCFGLFYQEELIGISTGWTTIRIYCGKQLELDNVIVSNKYHSNGYGKWFMDEIEKWCIKNDYDTIELNAYLANSRGHKFYFNQGYKILGFHFQKVLN